MNVERPRLIREAGLDPTKSIDVDIWKAQRKAENKIKRAEKAAEDLEMLEQQRARYRQLEQSSDSSSRSMADLPDSYLEQLVQRDKDKSSFLGSILFD